jgi:hypothetical protein
MNYSSYCLITGRTLAWKDVLPGHKQSECKPKLISNDHAEILRAAIYSSVNSNKSVKDIANLLNIKSWRLISILNTGYFGKMSVIEVKNAINIAQSWPRQTTKQINSRKMKCIERTEPEELFNHERKLIIKMINENIPFTTISKDIKIKISIIYKIARSIGWTNENDWTLKLKNV